MVLVIMPLAGQAMHIHCGLKVTSGTKNAKTRQAVCAHVQDGQKVDLLTYMLHDIHVS